MLHLLYIFAFTIIAFMAISNLIRSLITVSAQSQRYYAGGNSANRSGGASQSALHPELLDEDGRPISEPLLVMRSVSVEDAREQLDALYNSSPSPSKEEED